MVIYIPVLTILTWGLPYMQGKITQPQTLKKIRPGLFGFCSVTHQITAAYAEHHKLCHKS